MFGFSSGGESETDLDIFLSAFQVSFPIFPGSSSTYNTYRQPGGTSPYPLDYVIDQAGRVAYANTEYDPAAMVAVIDNLLAHPAAVSQTPVARALTVTARPNPFNPLTEIRFALRAAGLVTVDIHDARGRLVRHLVTTRRFEAGPVSVPWDGNTDDGRVLPTGLYLAHVRAGRFSATGKLTLVR